VLLSRGSRQQAVTALTEAAAIAAELKAAPLAADVRALADRARITLPAVAPEPVSVDPDGLTAREAEVLALVGRGRTNAEIAAELFVSLSTVKTHLTNVHTKLGTRNRVEIAAWAWEHGRVP
jgi:DNA-binding CsgD family transcriptional regulator